MNAKLEQHCRRTSEELRNKQNEVDMREHLLQLANQFNHKLVSDLHAMETNSAVIERELKKELEQAHQAIALHCPRAADTEKAHQSFSANVIDLDEISFC